MPKGWSWKSSALVWLAKVRLVEPSMVRVAGELKVRV